VCANAGVSRHKDIFAADSDWEKEPDMVEIDVNTKGCLFTVRIGMAYLRRNQEGGDVVMTSSIAGWKECSTIAPYTASKHAVIGLGRGLYQQAAKEGVRVNVVCPWMTSESLLCTGGV
jgi:NAD(P)-dependent dehydrogenase (short-subunit alcohol dehydrogenase family)